MDVHKEYQLLYSADAIAARITEMGREISPWVLEVSQRDGRDVLGVPVLRGGIFFFADLVRQISGSIDIDPIQSSAYAGHNAQSESVRIGLGEIEPAGRSILLMDDVCDSGRTLRKLSAKLVELGAAEVRAAVLIKRTQEHESFDPDYVGFVYPGREWFVGYGMDDEGRWRNLPPISVIPGSGK